MQSCSKNAGTAAKSQIAGTIGEKDGFIKHEEAVRQINDATQKMVRLTERYRDGIQIPKLTAKQKMSTTPYVISALLL